MPKLDKPKPNGGKGKAAKPAPPAKSPALPPPVPPLFRRIDWLILAIVFAVIWAIYLYTLAPELTLEDSGELCTGSYYAGIPHPPGYPFWAIYSWLWTAILPMGNVAWRVEVGESFGIAMGCGMLALLVSRGSSMLMEGIEELRGITRQWENTICMVSGFVAGMMVGLDGSVWGEAVVINRISIFAVPWLILVMLMLMRWMYAPHQKRYLYLAMLFYGICATIHQSMLLGAMGVEVAIALVQPRLGRDLFLANSLIYLVCLFALGSQSIPALNNMTLIEKVLFNIVGIGSIVGGGWMSLRLTGFFSEWKTVLWMGLLWCAGVAFYFYEPIAGMTCPPMQWGYPRTVEGFFHALSRGQYETSHGTFDLIRFLHQLWYLVQGLSESFSWVFMFVGLLPFFFLFKMQKRERAWIWGLAAIYFCLAVPLVNMLDVGLDKSSADLNQVFFTASHALFAVMIGYGMTLMAAYMATHYQRSRFWAIVGSGVAVLLALYSLAGAASQLAAGPGGEVTFPLLGQLPQLIAQAFAKNHYGLPIFANLLLAAIPIVFLAALIFYRRRGPILILLGLFLVMPVYSGLSHWYKSEQRNHWFGYWFGHDMFTPPYGIYPEMTRNAILFGGTDPGRFCPTYIIFCESFIPHSCQPKQDQHFDRRDVYIITQNALADGTYLDYLRSQYFRSHQVDPPFFSNLIKYVLGIPFGDDNSVVNGLANFAYYVLDVPFTKLGAHIEARRRAEGVYPPTEIYIPSQDDSSECFQAYRDDFARRAALGQLQPGEGVKTENNQMQISGQFSVMKINGLLCKIIFDRNPTNEFFVEESFALDWMFPYETPFGIIIKLNRDPLPALPPDVFKKDHEFWCDYCQRTIGNWITYDTTVRQIADFAEKVYLHNDFNGFTGDRKFIRDEDGQKAFSKLRSSQAGIYAWRCGPACPPEYRQKTDADEQALIRETDFAFKQSFAFCPYSPEAVFRYANFLIDQAAKAENRGRFDQATKYFDDAIIVAQTCVKFDPYNGQAQNLIETITKFKQESTDHMQFSAQLQQMEDEARRDPTNFQNVLTLAQVYCQMQQTNAAVALFQSALPLSDRVLTTSNATYVNVAAIAQIAFQMHDLARLESALAKLAALVPDQPEPPYDLAALQAELGKSSNAMKNLQAALALNARRLATNSSAHNLLNEARTDPRFNSLRHLPAFQALVPPQ